ncbi:MAG TPA: DUF523 and DUF1722 domain-containing protein [Candidatus Macondimonas sp.]|nr:DUF523 and DUF1722 domain-containing protein [Candidatus Macondimonas sp.]
MSIPPETGATPPWPRLTLGISACLLGEAVRYDGGHKRDRCILETLAPYFDFRPFCPEMAIGLGAPRPPLRLVQEDGSIRARGIADQSLDVTADLAAFGQRVAAEAAHDLSGYVFKARSPSCGMARVPVHDEAGRAHPRGRGIYADAVLNGLPLLPAEEEGRLQDAALRENFLERVHAYARWRTLLAQGPTAETLVQFHTGHKLLLMAHGSEPLRGLGRIVANIGRIPLAEATAQYGQTFMRTLRFPATRKRHANVLYHAMGYLKNQLAPPEKAELAETIEAYRQGDVPRIVPISLMRHHLRRHPHPYLTQQVYWNGAPPGVDP